MTPRQLEARISEAIAQETGCIPMWESRPLTAMEVTRIGQRIAPLLNQAQEEAMGLMNSPQRAQGTQRQSPSSANSATSAVKEGGA